MNPLAVSVFFAIAVLAGAAIGAWARRWVPHHHLDTKTGDVVKLGVGLLGTLAALVLGLVVASAKTSFDTKMGEVQTVAAKILQLDRNLQHLGPVALSARAALRALVAARIGHLGDSGAAELPSAVASARGLAGIEALLRAIAPADDAQRMALTRALNLGEDIERVLASVATQSGSSITTPLLLLLVGWFAVILAGWNFIAPVNGTTLFVDLLCALSISGAIFLLLQMDQPFGGVIQVSDSPLRLVLPQLAE